MYFIPTTAQRLAAFRDELLALNFSENEAWTLVEFAARQIIADGQFEAHVPDVEAVTA